MPKLWIRVDNRLIHGQIVENWLPYLNAGHILVANDQLAHDELQQEIIGLAVPKGVKLLFSPVSGVLETLNAHWCQGDGRSFLVMFARCSDAREALQRGLQFSTLNIGNIHYGQGKQQICDHIALSREDIKCLRFFENKGVQLDFRCLPNRQVQVKTIW
ncbi:MAG: PTS sugar transporter subunit IIB [Desulfohalobiaceae bacterium]|nr:PTS sugar transporter subunit IIB [Desulfohalobiaceae bacterium]